jgi:hypothetical protein
MQMLYQWFLQLQLFEMQLPFHMWGNLQLEQF